MVVAETSLLCFFHSKAFLCLQEYSIQDQSWDQKTKKIKLANTEFKISQNVSPGDFPGFLTTMG